MARSGPSPLHLAALHFNLPCLKWGTKQMVERRWVYLVDDDEAIRRSASFMLRTTGFSVKTFSSGVEFLDELKGLEPGCIVLDVQMPEISGLEVQAALREHGITFP